VKIESKDTKLYTSADTYFKGPDGMKNEVTMWYVSAGLLMEELAKRKGFVPFGGLGKVPGYDSVPNINDSIDLLDLCSGPGNFVNHLSFVFPWLKVVCVDLNETFLKTGKGVFKKWKFMKSDVIELDLKSKFGCVTASSAYHHIKDSQKLDFLRIIKKHLKDDGFALICENFIPDYSTNKERTESIVVYYNELLKYYEQGNATGDSIKAIDEVRQLELSGVEEHKVSRKIFEEQLGTAGLVIDVDIVVWQPDKLKQSNAGSHVFVIKHTRLQ
jgi:ubiquinone/menaquinone biosynthesis C-methylase UbiE